MKCVISLKDWQNVVPRLDGKKQLIPAENTVTVLPGIRRYYLMQIDQDDIGSFVEDIVSLKDEPDHSRLLDEYGIRRSDSRFWALGDELHEQWRVENPTGFAYLGYSRLENRK